MERERKREQRERRDKYTGGSVLWYPWHINLINEGDKPVKFILYGLLAFINFLLQTSPVLCKDKHKFKRMLILVQG
jgi:hypothetical protein